MLTENGLGLKVRIEDRALSRHVDLITVHFCVDLNFSQMLR